MQRGSNLSNAASFLQDCSGERSKRKNRRPIQRVPRGAKEPSFGFCKVIFRFDLFDLGAPICTYKISRCTSQDLAAHLFGAQRGAYEFPVKLWI
jgi:hypothetical protein